METQTPNQLTPYDSDNDDSDKRPGSAHPEFDEMVKPVNYQKSGVAGDLGKAEAGSSLFNKDGDNEAAKSNQAISPGEVGNQEAAAGEASPSAPGPSFNKNDSGSASLGSKISNFLGRGLNKRRAMAGGGAAGVLITLFFVVTTTSTVELVNIRENALGNGNSLVNKAMQHRYNSSMAKLMRSLAPGAAEDNFNKNLNRAKFVSRFEAAGFKVAMNEDGTLKEFSYKGKELSLDPKNKNAFSDFVSRDNLGREIAGKLDDAGALKAQTWKGVYASELWKNMKQNFHDWTSKKAPDEGKATNPAEEEAARLRVAENNNILSTDQTTVTAAEAEKQAALPPNKDGTSASATDIGDPAGTQAELTRLMNDPSYAGAGNDGLTRGVADSLAHEVTDPKVLGAEVGKSFTVSFLEKAVNVLGKNQIGCQVKGRLNFVAAVKNVAIAYQAARFAMMVATAADNQKAGVATSQGLKLLMLYMNTANPKNGKSAVNSGGMRALFGDKTATASSFDLGKFATSRNPTGLFGSILKIVNNYVPGLSTSQCKFVNNKFVSLGGLAVGGLLALFSDGGTTAADFADNLALGVIQQVALDATTQVLLEASTGILLTGLEHNGEEVGDALASGFGAVNGMNAGANGLRPASKQLVGVLQGEVNQDQKYALAHESLYTRYLSLSNSQSLASTVDMQLAPLVSSPGNMATIVRAGLPNMLGNIVNTFNPFSAKVSAATDPTAHCQDDPMIKKYNLATDQFCNPIMANAPNLDLDQTQAILLANNEIDANGDAIPNSDYDKWIQSCATGRTGLLYTPATAQNAAQYQNGELSPENLVNGYNPCVSSGPHFTDDNVAGMYDRFSAWYGFKGDEANTLQIVNGDFGGSGSSSSAGSSIGDTGWPFKPGVATTIDQCFTIHSGGHHPGLDIWAATGEGSPIYAITAGIVTVTNTMPGNYGPNYVTIAPVDANGQPSTDPNALGSGYGHMDTATVATGDKVSVGQQVGTEGNQGDSQGAHLHLNLFPGKYTGTDGPNIDPFPHLTLPSSGVSNQANCT